MNKFWFLAQAISNLGKIRTRTWLVLGAVALGFVGLLGWAGIAIMSWLWTQAPAVTEAGKRLAGDAVTQVEQVAPELKEQAAQWVPGVKEQLDRWLPGRAEAPLANDVSGADAGPVARFPGLVRSHFAREEQAVEVRYAGGAAFETVLAHYLQGFTAAGYLHEVISAAPEGEQHRFRRGQESIDLSLLRRPDGLLEVHMKVLPQ
ncbi:MAG: hypothetical protein IDH49_12875 [Gammaproteobacteria bacterium]|nr:hypothetical protein [Gammaproteobacteria bacterium]